MFQSDRGPLRAAIYGRVSSEEQREGQTIDSQIAELERFAHAQDWIVTGIYKDEGWSGAALARPELDRLRDDASRGAFDIVLINDVDRLARDVSHLGVIKRDLERHGVQVRFRKLPAEQSPTANLMVNILGSFAEFERDLILDRMRRGRRHKVEVRQQYLGSRAPYGYRYRPKTTTNGRDGILELLPEEALIVKQIFHWVDAEGLSAMKVIKRLNELKVPTKNRKSEWGKSSLLRILHCEMYTGIWYYNKSESYEPASHDKRTYHRTVKYRMRPRPRHEWIPVHLPKHLQIIDREQWERVQAQLARNRSFAPRNAQHRYVLKGLIQCGHCGARYVGDPNHGKFYYRCLHRCRKFPSIREEKITDLVWSSLSEAIQNPEIVLSQLARREAEFESQRTVMADERTQVEQALAKLDEEESRLLEAYRFSAITAEILKREIAQLQQRRSVLAERQHKLQYVEHSPKASETRAPVEAFCQSVAGRLEKMDWSERQRLIQLLIERIYYYGDGIRICAVLPLKDRSGSESALDKIAEGGIATMEIYRQARNTVFPTDRIAPTGNERADRNPVNYDRIETTEINDHDRSTGKVIEEVRFEIMKPVPVIQPLFTERQLSELRSLIDEHPQVTLRELCGFAEREMGISITISRMFKVVARLGLRRKDRHLPKESETHSNNSLPSVNGQQTVSPA